MLHDGPRHLLRHAALRKATVLVVAVAHDDVGRVALQLDVVVSELAELDIVDPDVLFFGRHAQTQARNEIEQEEDDTGQDEGVRETGD